LLQVAAHSKTVLITCGALAREVVALIRLNGWQHLIVKCLPPDLHNRPGKIPETVRQQVQQAKSDGHQVVVLYADCGTGGLLDVVCEEENVERIQGPHCNAFYSGVDTFQAIHEEQMDCFFLTDFLARHFERLVWKGLGLDRHPGLVDTYFRHYSRLIYLAQIEDASLVARAKEAAERLGLEYEYRFTGYGDLGSFMQKIAGNQTDQTQIIQLS
jgi:Protein of unknown function (DUF1638)